MDQATLKRFTDKIEFTDTCWNWTAATTARGYPKFKLSSYNLVLSHRLAYEWWVAPIPSKLTVDHICQNIKCVNPEHLQVMTRQANAQKQNNSTQTHCPSGHLRSKHQGVQSSGKTYCLACQRIRGRQHYWGKDADVSDLDPERRM